MEIVKEEKKSKKQQPKMTMKIVDVKILIMALLQIKNFFKKKEKKTQIEDMGLKWYIMGIIMKLIYK